MADTPDLPILASSGKIEVLPPEHSAKYWTLLRREVTESRLKALPETVFGVSGWVAGFILWYSGAQPWQLVTVFSLSGFVSTAMVYLSGRQLFNKERMEKQRAQALLAKRRKNQAFADRLTAQYRHGLHNVLHAPMQSEEEFCAWLNRENEWTAETRRILEEFGCSDQEISLFWEIRIIDEWPQIIHPEPRRNHQLRMLNTRLARLQRLSDLYAEHPVLA